MQCHDSVSSNSQQHDSNPNMPTAICVDSSSVCPTLVRGGYRASLFLSKTFISRFPCHSCKRSKEVLSHRRCFECHHGSLCGPWICEVRLPYQTEQFRNANRDMGTMWSGPFHRSGVTMQVGITMMGRAESNTRRTPSIGRGDVWSLHKYSHFIL